MLGRLPTQATRGCVLLSACLAVVSPAYAASEWVSIKPLPGFNAVQAQLQALVDKNGRETVNHLCVIGQKDGAHFQAEVYWPSENKLILWIPNINDPETLIHSKRYVDLKRDVRDNVGTSTYLLSRSFVDETLKACASKGDHFTVDKTPSPAPTRG